MDELTFEELSLKAKTHFEAREWQESTNCLNEARDRFASSEYELAQLHDGSIGKKEIVLEKVSPVEE